jgi:hypothetical protein
MDDFFDCPAFRETVRLLDTMLQSQDSFPRLDVSDPLERILCLWQDGIPVEASLFADAATSCLSQKGVHLRNVHWSADVPSSFRHPAFCGSGFVLLLDYDRDIVECAMTYLRFNPSANLILLASQPVAEPIRSFRVSSVNLPQYEQIIQHLKARSWPTSQSPSLLRIVLRRARQIVPAELLLPEFRAALAVDANASRQTFFWKTEEGQLLLVAEANSEELNSGKSVIVRDRFNSYVKL